MPLLDIGMSEQDLPFLVMEYLDGGTLRQRYPRGVRVPLEIVVRMMAQVASALQYAHDRHLIHRDVKPENLLARADGSVLLSDFGLVTVAHASSSVNLYQLYGGTLPYMAPEQYAGQPRAASDQYALAVVVYEWLAGTRPFQGSGPEIALQHLRTPPPSLRYSGGLLIRLQTNQFPITLGYFFEVGIGGNYEIRRLNAGSFTALQDWTDSSAITGGRDSLNVLQVIAHGNDFLFYVNGVYLTHVQDSVDGVESIGFATETDATGPGDAVFSNLRVYP